MASTVAMDSQKGNKVYTLFHCERLGQGFVVESESALFNWYSGKDFNPFIFPWLPNILKKASLKIACLEYHGHIEYTDGVVTTHSLRSQKNYDMDANGWEMHYYLNAFYTISGEEIEDIPDEVKVFFP